MSMIMKLANYHSYLKYVKIYQKKYFSDHSHDWETMYRNIGKFAGHPLIKADEVHRKIHDSIISGNPFMYGRFGSIEIAVIGFWLANDKARLSKHFNMLCNNAGFFPFNIELIPKFVDIMIDSMGNVDYQGVFAYVQTESYCVRRCMPASVITSPFPYIQPWYTEHPWTRALKGKKVLIIHPFEETIRSQYTKRHLLFGNQDILPEFELRTLKAVQSIGGGCTQRFTDWFEALEYMHLQSRRLDFDVAIIGCGAYGYPLAAKIKADGKQAINMSGATQLLFGIKGKAWERPGAVNDTVRALFNEHWVRPSAEETPTVADTVDGGAYW